MNGIASLLKEPEKTTVERLWHELDSKCGLQGVQTTPYPHLTWQVTQGYDLPKLDRILKKISHRTKPFSLRTDGLGIFTGEKPVVYISIVKDENLLRLHESLWERTKEFAREPDLQYSPPHWIPHITLVYNDLTQDNMNCALQILAFQKFEWEIKIDQLTLFTQSEGKTDQASTYKLGD